ncbi:outer envelope protein [Salix suchowensis]|nr:outer envelope protein [Salix suchowensis]
MFRGMMDPELEKIAQEQMSRMTPADFARIQQQVMSNPELVRMATESMKNMKPDDLKQAAEQLRHTRPEEMAEIGEKMMNASPEEIAAMRARADVQETYETNAAHMLKKQGNELHSQGKFNDALRKYLLELHPPKGRTLWLACSLNLMSCYLKTKQVLGYDANNVKALYRRGQAYRELGPTGSKFDAVSDLRKAHEVSPDDETIADILRNAEERLAQEGGHHATKGLSPLKTLKSSSTGYQVKQPRESADISKSGKGGHNGSSEANLEALEALKDDPEAMRSFQNFISNADSETLAALSGAKAGEVSPDMFKTASNMIGKLSPEELQRMLQMASSFQGATPFTAGRSSDSSFNGLRSGVVPPNVTPDMLKTASDMMSKMSPEELQKMFEMTSSSRGNGPVPATASALKTDRSSSGVRSKPTETQEKFAADGNNGFSETSSSGDFLTRRNAPPSSFPASTSDIQEQMRNQMKDPAMQQMFTTMMKNISPEMMANMSEQFGVKLSREDAAKAQQAMSSLSPEDLDKMMRWADRIQRGAEGAKKAKNWLLGRPGMILGICMLFLAIILHQLGFIGR